MTTLIPPCQKCNSRRGGGDCVICHKFFCQKHSVKKEAGKFGEKILYGIFCKECEPKQPNYYNLNKHDNINS